MISSIERRYKYYGWYVIPSGAKVYICNAESREDFVNRCLSSTYTMFYKDTFIEESEDGRG